MSIASEITRLQNNRNTIRNTLITWGVAESTDTLADLATTISGISKITGNTTLDTTTTSRALAAGYYDGTATVSITLETKTATPSTTAQTVTPTSGSVLSSVIVEAIETETKTVTPSTSSQDITPTTGKFLTKVTVNAIPSSYGDASNADVTAADILAGKTAIGYNSSTGAAIEIEGTMANQGKKTIVLDTATTSYTIPAGYHNGQGTVSLSTQTKTVEPSTSSQTVTPDSNKVLSEVTVEAMPAGALSKGNGHLTLTAGAGSVSASGTGVTLTEVAQANVGDYYVTAQGSGSVSGTGSGTVSVGTAGYIAKNTSETSNTASDSKSSNTATKYFNVSTETKTADPADTAQDITPTTGSLLSKVTVGAITYSAAPVITLGYGTLSASTTKGRYNAGTNNISIGLGTGDNTLTAAAGHILNGYRAIGVNAAGTAVASVTGTMANNGAVNQTLTTSATSYTIPAGYHNGSGKVSISTQTKTATPGYSAVTVTPDSGKVLSSVTVEAITESDALTTAIVDGGAYIESEAGAAVTDYGWKTTVTIPAGHWSTQQVITVDYPNIFPATESEGTSDKMLAGYKLYNAAGELIVGTMINRGAVSQTLTTSTTSYTIPAGYHNGSGTVSLTTQTKTVDPADTAQDVTPDSTKVLSKVTVTPITYSAAPTVTLGYGTLSASTVKGRYNAGSGNVTIGLGTGDNTLTGSATQVLSGYRVIGVNAAGTAVASVTGTMANNGAVSQTLTTASTSYTIPAGYHNGSGKVSISTQSKTVDPSTSAQTVTPDSTKVLSSVTVSAMPAGALNKGAGSLTLTAGAGSVSSTGTGVTLTEVAASGRGSYYVTSTGSGTVSGSGSGTVSVGTAGYLAKNTSETSNAATDSKSSNTATKYYNISTETKAVDPATTAQTVTPGTGKLISSVTVSAMPAGALSSGNGSITLTAGSGSVSSTGTGVTLTEVAASGRGSYYVTSTGSGTVSGSGSGTVSVGTAGYLAKNTSETSNAATDSKSSNTATKYYNISTETKAVDPATTAQTVTPTAGTLLSKVTVAAMPAGALSKGDGSLSLTAGAGSVSASGTGVTISEVAAANVGSYYVTATGSGTVSGSGSGTVSVGTAGYLAKNTSKSSNAATGSKSSNTATKYYNISTETKAVDPADTAQTITPGTGKLISGVTVSAITYSDAPTVTLGYGTLSASTSKGRYKAGSSNVTIGIGSGNNKLTAAASHILNGYRAIGVNAAGTAVASVSGTMANNGATGTTLTANDSSYTIPAGYTSGGTVTVSIPNLVSSTVSNNFTSYQEFTANSPVTASTSVASAPTAGSIRVTGGIAATSGIIGSQVYNAVWNDLADAIPVDDACELEYGYCYCFDGEHYYKSSKYLDDGIIGIHSDTAGFVMGTKGEGKEMQVAVAGFVLAYVDKEYKPGTLLTCTENGYLTEISKQDKIENPEKVIASFWKPETKESWGSPERQVKVNGRMWVKVR